MIFMVNLEVDDQGRNFLVNRWESKSIIVINSLILPRVCDCILHSGLTDFLFHEYSWYLLLCSSIYVLYAALSSYLLPYLWQCYTHNMCILIRQRQ